MKSVNCKHTKQPEPYIQWHLWAEKMSKTHRQIKCKNCGLLAIWKKKTVFSTGSMKKVSQKTCKNCYGKGYRSEFIGTIGFEDFGGEGFYVPPHVQFFACRSCPLGKKIQRLLTDISVAKSSQPMPHPTNGLSEKV